MFSTRFKLAVHVTLVHKSTNYIKDLCKVYISNLEKSKCFGVNYGLFSGQDLSQGWKPWFYQYFTRFLSD